MTRQLPWRLGACRCIINPLHAADDLLDLLQGRPARAQLRRDVALRGMPRDKVLAIVVSLLDATRVRIGNAEYARNNDSYGLTTLRNRHVEFVCDGKLLLRFAGKGGTDRETASVRERIEQLHPCERPGGRGY